MTEPRTKSGLKAHYTRLTQQMVAGIIRGELMNAEDGKVDWGQMRRLASKFCVAFAADNHTFDAEAFLFDCGFPLPSPSAKPTPLCPGCAKRPQARMGLCGPCARADRLAKTK